MISSPVGFDLVSVIIDTFCVQIFGERSATYAIEAEFINFSNKVHCFQIGSVSYALIQLAFNENIRLNSFAEYC